MEKNTDKTMHLQKRMALLGICSRREAEYYIKQGWVLVNSKTAILGDKINITDKIELTSDALNIQNNKYVIMLNKPVNYVSTQAEKGYREAKILITKDNFWTSKKTKSLPNNVNKAKLSCAGRLDIDSTGLLILTNDGRVVKKIIGENSNIEKEYIVKVVGNITEDKLSLLKYGLSLDGQNLKQTKIKLLENKQINFTLTQGKKRQIRRMCELVDLKVFSLKRIRIGNIQLGNLPMGKWRFIKQDELNTN